MNSADKSGGCPSKAKKSKTSTNEYHEQSTFYNQSQWNHLPAVLLHDIFNLLDKDDRKNASSTCKTWRQIIFHPKWWPSMTFKIEQDDINKAKFYTSAFGKITSEVTIKLDSLSQVCMEEFILLLQALNENNHLKQLMIEPTHCRFEVPNNKIEEQILALLKPCLPKLKKFSIGCIDSLSSSAALEDILQALTPSIVTHLGLASVKDDPTGFYQISYFNPELIRAFNKLKILSVDYEQLSDEFLYNLEPATHLERLIVHLHGVRPNHPGTSNQAWLDFHLKHPACEFRLTVIHAFNDIDDLHERVLRPAMPLTHLKVFFCEVINLYVLEFLSKHYHKTLRSIMWIDSHSNTNGSWTIAKSHIEYPDPLVLIAWLCKKLEEIVLYGYKYWEEDLVAIGRLRGEDLKKLEIPAEEILKCGENAILDIRKSIKRPWAPVKLSELHPVVWHPTEGDSDEYLLPIVLADLR